MIKVIGKGSFGQVVKARCLQTGSIYAIKLIKHIFTNIYECRKVYREISILRQLSAMKTNIFTPKLHDVILAESSRENKKKKFKALFLVMDFDEQDLRKMFNNVEA